MPGMPGIISDSPGFPEVPDIPDMPGMPDIDPPGTAAPYRPIRSCIIPARSRIPAESIHIRLAP